MIPNGAKMARLPKMNCHFPQTDWTLYPTKWDFHASSHWSKWKADSPPSLGTTASGNTSLEGRTCSAKTDPESRKTGVLRPAVLPDSSEPDTHPGMSYPKEKGFEFPVSSGKAVSSIRVFMER
ncbi:hypothetical protein CEXT_23611 [Caerostris extrusa]|uniref:Uncharacterized protein n=1 Tax=Caerostris extrusa TaxID=172846 RepID=A0AAV4P8N4_CAEEX|nr:hypothetical protein CEXT_23611 [Caerostris extrusa]